ncbi:peptidase, M48 family [Malaciobacter marinus]|uniref:Peptidase M48 family protein n=1 Tax=Malaciobacter marinus TaxID=505249 RepID=A0A347TJQ8_9BACT|nr:M48 family metallopeptidase [Malaciobacter marinus]AXX86836.1 peptidase, M48 family [Malaciobacter marinus]PHO14769.1 peptidase M48 family protein [Malaciobacter marinus]
MQIKHIFSLIIFTLFLIGCTHKTPYTNRDQMILISTEQELALGEQSYEKTLKESKVIKNTKDALRVKNIGEKIAKVTKKNYKWEFNLIENKAKNAFCLPGGKVVVYTGILKIAKNDSQLATVISHEIAHALARHGAERVSAGMLSQGVQVIGNIVLGSQAPQYTKTFNIAYGVGAQYGVLMPYGRMQESEADEIGIYLMHKAGYDLKEAVKFWENMSKGKKENFEFFSTHPNSENRIKNIKKIISKLN